MDGGDVCRYVGVGLTWRRIRNCCTWGIVSQYHVGCVNLEKRTLVSCGGSLESYCLGGGNECRCVGVDVGLDQMMAARR